MLDNFRWYRRLRGGHWYKYEFYAYDLSGYIIGWLRNESPQHIRCASEEFFRLIAEEKY